MNGKQVLWPVIFFKIAPHRFIMMPEAVVQRG
jgi:hypothetical protein